ncbi:MAG: hypothetical protein HQL90_15650 [Magnetococcales bacterium]|nr:hypothetical protein [Magnetococcales bacterium]
MLEASSSPPPTEAKSLPTTAPVLTDLPATLQESWLTPSTEVTLYDTPQMGGVSIKELPKQTPLRILQSRDGWMQVECPAGHRGWMMGPGAPGGSSVQSGLFILPEQGDAGPPVMDQNDL